MRQIAVICTLIMFFLVFSSASAYYIDRHLIQVNIDQNGNGKVNEMFFIVFRNSTDLLAFRQKAVDNGPSLEVWEAFDGNIATHIDSIKGGTGRVTFEEKQTENYVSIEYETSEPVMVKKSETSREITWEINQDVFKSFETGSIYSIPNNTDISILLPKNAQIIGGIVPTAVVSGNIVNWSGPINVSGNLVVDYSTEKQIAPGIGISKTLQELFSSNAMPVTIVVLIIVLLVIYTQRRKFSKKIEKYVVDHSEIESKPGKEEDELD